MKRIGLQSLALAAVALSLSASAVFAGEITGNGTLLQVDDSKWGTGLHARSFGAFSGQEDVQFFEDDENTIPRDPPTKGEPGHSQSWGQIPKAVREISPRLG